MDDHLRIHINMRRVLVGRSGLAALAVGGARALSAAAGGEMLPHTRWLVDGVLGGNRTALSRSITLGKWPSLLGRRHARSRR